jgi:hypothetical protein
MNRPTITTFFPEDFTPKDVAKMFQENPELKQYIHALDAYIDHLEEKPSKLQAFKDYVHQRLDEAGIEKEPNGEHSQHGCRIGDRLDLVLSERIKLKDAMVIPNIPIGFRVDVLPIPFMKKGEAHLLVHPENHPNKIEIETDHGKIGVFNSKFLKHGEIGIVDLSIDFNSGLSKSESVNFQIVKDYSQDQIDLKYRKGLCVECGEKIIHDGTINQGWTYKSHCEKCNTHYLFDESDMGQSMPYLRKNPDQS